MSTRAERPLIIDADGGPRMGFTRADVDAMLAAGVLDPEERFEFFDGEVFPMSPEGPLHRRFSILLGRALTDAYRDPWIVARATMDFGHVFFEPDYHGLPLTLIDQPIKGPDAPLVIEIGISSLQRDLGRKSVAYAREGVREYWVIDPVGAVTCVFANPDRGALPPAQDVPFTAPLAAQFKPTVTFTLAAFLPEQGP